MPSGSTLVISLLRSCILPCLLFAGPLCADVLKYTEERQPCTSHTALMQPFFGDLHVHTRYSLDASTQGTRTTPAQAYEFAQGARLGIQPWTDKGQGTRSMQLSQPLDFAMVSDHAELIGEVNMCNTPQIEGYSSWQCQLYRSWPRAAYYLFNFRATMSVTHMGMCGDNGELCLKSAVAPWQEMQAAAEKFYDRSADCTFTTFNGYEWTGMESRSGGNLHRNVVFRNDHVPALPISFIDTPGAALLWDALDVQCGGAGAGCESLVIPHNSNISAGYMFSGRLENGAAMTLDYAKQRARYEPLVEIMQHKGASECYYKSGVTRDELCAFEQQPIDNIAGYNNPPKPDSGFVRHALLRGMALQQTLGANPYQFGVIGSTDTHLGAPGAVEESQFPGHGGAGVPAKDEIPPGLPDKLEYNPGGLAVLWAQENSRDALFAAMRRREAYATSGPRIVSRFFGGWNYSQELCSANDREAQAYADGVPMGGELTPVVGKKPTFLVAASQDVGTKASPGNPLQRVQIIKGWVTAKGETREKVIDVAGDADNGASVDARTCATRGKGFAQLCAVWTDEDFNPDEQSYYYSRVVENPSCRWSQKICVANRVDCSRPDTIGEGLEGCCAPEHVPVIQERAWSSPIWYTPAS